MNRYQIIEEIGHGAYSIVYKALDLVTNTIVAIKSINNKNPDIHLVLNREIRTLQTLQHPNIIKLLGLYNEHCYTNLVFQYLPFDLITYYKDVRKKKNRNLNDEQITYIVYQMCQALSCMHQRGIMHRDIKPENVLIDPITLRIKLIDFGFATSINNYVEHTQYMITRWYRPLQIVLNLPYDAKSDIFALGALVLELYQGEEIFRSSSNIDQLYWILEICGYPGGWAQAILRMAQLGVFFNSKKVPQIYKMTEKLRPEAESLIIGMLQTCPHSRLSIVQILQHRYFSMYSKQHLKRNQNLMVSDEQQYRHTGGRYRTNSTNFDQLYKKSQGLVKSTQKLYGTNVEMKQNNYLSPSNQNNGLDFNLNLNKLELKKQNGNLMSTERSITSNQEYIQLNPRRLSQNVKLGRQYKFRRLQRNNSHLNGLDYRFGCAQGDERGRYRTEGNEQVVEKKCWYHYDTSRKEYLSPNEKNKFMERYIKKDLNNEEQEKGVRNKGKAYQGISVISLKIPDIKDEKQSLLRSSAQKPTYSIGNHIEPIITKKKEPTFTKIRDKFATTNRNDKMKISLTERNQNNGERRNYNMNYR